MSQKKVGFALVMFMLILSFSLNNVYAVSISYDWSDSIIVGQAFDIGVVANGVEFDPFLGDGDLLAFGFDVDFDSSLFSYNGAAVGSLFFDDSFFFPNTDVAGSAFPPVGGDNILLATLNFTPLFTGDYNIGIISDILDPNEGLITLMYGQVDITRTLRVGVNEAPAPVPEPASFILLGSGLLGLAGCRRRTK